MLGLLLFVVALPSLHSFPPHHIMFKKAILFGVVSGLITSGVTAANVYLFHVSWLWLPLYVGIPTAIAIGIITLERRVGRYLLVVCVFLLVHALLVGLFELPIYKYWQSFKTPAGAVYTRYQMDAFYPFPGLIFIALLPVLFGFSLWIYSRGRVQVKSEKQ